VGPEQFKVQEELDDVVPRKDEVVQDDLEEFQETAPAVHLAARNQLDKGHDGIDNVDENAQHELHHNVGEHERNVHENPSNTGEEQDRRDHDVEVPVQIEPGGLGGGGGMDHVANGPHQRPDGIEYEQETPCYKVREQVPEGNQRPGQVHR